MHNLLNNLLASKSLRLGAVVLTSSLLLSASTGAGKAEPTSPPAVEPVAELLHEVPAAAPLPVERVMLASAMMPRGEGVSVKRVMWMEVTAYCSCKKCCGPNAIGLTASGRPVSYNDGRFVAADTRLLPFGTKLRIPGYAAGQSVEVIDRGGAIKGHRLDIYFPSHEQALEWGRKWMAVTVE